MIDGTKKKLRIAFYVCIGLTIGIMISFWFRLFFGGIPVRHPCDGYWNKTLDQIPLDCLEQLFL